MKSLKILSGILLTVVLLQTAMAAVIVPSQESLNGSAKKAGKLVRSTYYKGAIIPVVDLPVVEITGTKPGTGIVSASYSNGTYIANANLPVIEITATREGKAMLRGCIRNGEAIFFAELPVIEITSDFPLINIAATRGIGKYLMPVVNLPEITISGNTQEHHLVEAVLNNGVPMPVVNLPSIEITPETAFWVTTANSNYLFINNNVKWFYISLKNCGISLGNKIICEVNDSFQGSFPGLFTTNKNIN